MDKETGIHQNYETMITITMVDMKWYIDAVLGIENFVAVQAIVKGW